MRRLPPDPADFLGRFENVEVDSVFLQSSSLLKASDASADDCYPHLEPLQLDLPDVC